MRPVPLQGVRRDGSTFGSEVQQWHGTAQVQHSSMQRRCPCSFNVAVGAWSA
jgi:hypothetical protein